MSDPRSDATTTTVPAAAADEGGPAHATFDRAGERFVVEREIGRGGMGRVVEATDVALDRVVAIKEVLSTRDVDIARFEREVRITARLEHPSIVPVHEAGRDPDGRPYYVMRRIEGQPLAGRIAAAATVRERLELLPSVLAAVDAAAFAHHRKIIHRDIKPANIMLGSHGETHLIDWGIARRLDETDAATGGDDTAAEPLTRAGLVYGTVAYMSPEQARGEVVDERADVFALGATLFHVLTGKPPFAGVSVSERVASGDELALGAIGPEVPAELVTIVAKAMAPLARRYRNAGELAADLRAFLGGRLVAAHHYTPAQRVLRFVRRHRVAVGVAVVATIAAVVLGTAAIVNIMRSRDEASEARVRAEEREQLALLAEAESVAEHDSARAVLRLAQLPLESPYAVRRHDIAAVAAVRGIPRGVSSGVLPRAGLAAAATFSPDGEQFVYAVEGSPLTTCVLGTGACRVLSPHSGHQLVWFEPNTILVSDAHLGLWALDARTGDRRTLVDGAIDHVWVTHGRIRYVDVGARELREIGLDGGAPRVLATDVELGIGEGDVAVVFGNHRLRLLTGGDEHALVDLELPPTSHGLALSLKRGRVAALAPRSEVYEWDFTGKVLHHWTVHHIINELSETAYGLYAASESGALWLTADLETTVGPAGTARLATITEAREGIAYAYLDGTIGVLEGEVDARLDQPGVARIFGARHSPYVAVVMRDGGARWWDLRQILPRRYDNPAGGVCWVTQSTIVGQGIGTMWVIDRATGRMTESEDGRLSLPVECHGQLGSTLYLEGAESFTFDLATGKIALADLPPGFVVDRYSESVVFVRGDRLVELPGGRRPERIRFAAPGPIARFVTTPRETVVGGDGWLRRIDRATGAVTEIPVDRYDRFAPDAVGAVWWVRDRALTWWDGAVHPPLELPARVAAAIPHPTGGASFILTDNSVWSSSPGSLRMLEGPSPFRTIIYDDGRMARVEDASLVMRSLVSNVSYTHRLRLKALSVTFEPHGLLVAVGQDLLVYDDPVPHDPAALKAWIARATNGVLSADNHEVVWPRASP